VLTCGEILFSVTGLEFAYSQAAVSMKTVLQAFWLSTVGIGFVHTKETRPGLFFGFFGFCLGDGMCRQLVSLHVLVDGLADSSHKYYDYLKTIYVRAHMFTCVCVCGPYSTLDGRSVVVIIVAESEFFKKQASEFFFFSGLISATTLLFLWMSSQYVLSGRWRVRVYFGEFGHAILVAVHVSMSSMGDASFGCVWEC
jgi:hypothetical protein